MNLLLNEIFPNAKIINDYFDFHELNMFWAKTNAIYQIFNKNILRKIKNNMNNTLQYCIEQIWNYIVKLNGFYYKKIFKHIYIDGTLIKFC